jgi:hypothetical protein
LLAISALWSSTNNEHNSFTPGKPRVWSEKRLGEVGVDSLYDLAPDGKRFAVVLDAEETSESKPITSVTVLLNFFDEVGAGFSQGSDSFERNVVRPCATLSFATPCRFYPGANRLSHPHMT